MTTQPSIYKKLLAAHQAVTIIPKRGRNDYHKYNYATEADILTIKETLNEHGLIVLPTMQAQETGFKPDGKSWAKVTLVFRVVDTETGECVESQFTGYAEDTFDKAIYKATTGANKYFYLKYFGAATGDDPEMENQVPVKNSGQNNWSPKKAAPAPKAQEPATLPEVAKNKALQAASRILEIKERYNLTQDDVLSIGRIDSIRELAEVGDYTRLEQALKYLQNRGYRAAV